MHSPLSRIEQPVGNPIPDRVWGGEFLIVATLAVLLLGDHQLSRALATALVLAVFIFARLPVRFFLLGLALPLQHALLLVPGVTIFTALVPLLIGSRLITRQLTLPPLKHVVLVGLFLSVSAFSGIHAAPAGGIDWKEFINFAALMVVVLLCRDWMLCPEPKLPFWRGLLWSVAISATVGGLLSVRELMQFDPLSYRFDGYRLDPNYFASFCAIAAAALMYLDALATPRLRVALLCLFHVAAALTFSKTGLALFGAVWLLYAFDAYAGTIRPIRHSLPLAALALVFVVLEGTLVSSFSTRFNTGGDVLSGRSLLYLAFWDAWTSSRYRVAFGCGIGCQNSLLEDSFFGMSEFLHSGYLEILAALGLVGALPFVWLVRLLYSEKRYATTNLPYAAMLRTVAAIILISSLTLSQAFRKTVWLLFLV